MNNTPPDVAFLLGEVHADVKRLLADREASQGRVSELEARVSKLEHAGTRMGVYLGIAAAIIPTIVTFVIHKLGVLSG